jgi:hypothetical protein
MLYAHPAILEACVIGARDGYRGETVKALIVLKQGARVAPEDITAWARERMAAFKVPRLVQFVDELPKTGGGSRKKRISGHHEICLAGIDAGGSACFLAGRDREPLGARRTRSTRRAAGRSTTPARQ